MILVDDSGFGRVRSSLFHTTIDLEDFVYIDVCLEFLSNNIGLKTNGVMCDLVLGQT